MTPEQVRALNRIANALHDLSPKDRKMLFSVRYKIATEAVEKAMKWIEANPHDEIAPIRMYVASKSWYGSKWQEARTAWAEIGVEIISTWIDESDEGESADMSDLWVRCVEEASTCDLLVAYHMPDEQWKGAFVEIGAALAHGRYVYVIGRPPGSWVSHPLVTFCENVEDAIEDYRTRTAR
jgi:hypothetical protein